MTRTFSIVTPSYNQGLFLEETIRSVLSQAGDFYIDYIVADGGSKDTSVEILQKYDELLKMNQFPLTCKGITFRWWSRKDKGAVAAVNEGFREARGDILAWIASDDFYEPGAFDVALRAFQSDSQIALVHGDCYYYYSKDRKNLTHSTETSFDDLLNKGNVIFAPSAFFTQKAFAEVGPMDETLDYVADFDLWLKIARVGTTSYIPYTLSNFRVWENSKSVLFSDEFSKKEKILLLKRYGGRRIDPKNIYRFKSKIRLFGFVQKKMPRLYTFSKRAFYRVLDVFRY